MSQPKKWFLGLVPVAGLLLASALMGRDGVEADLTGKGSAALASSGFSWAKVVMDGRDAVLTGEAPAPELRGMAVAAADRVFGIRLVHDKTTVLPEAKPYALNAVLEGNKLTLTGSVPSAAARAQVIEAAKKVFPSTQIDDQMKMARGAPASYLSGAGFGLGELAKLANGQMSLTDQALSITGRAGTVEAYDDVRRRLAALPAGLALVKGLGPGDITSPAIRPYLFNAVRGERDITLTGFAPDVRTKAEIADHAKRFFEGERVVDQLQIGVGAPAGFANAVRGGLQDLSRLLPGATLSLSDASIALRGLAPLDTARDQAVSAFRGRVPQGYGSSVEVNTAPPPPVITVLSECNILFQDLLSRARINFDTGSAIIAVESFGLLDRLVVVVRRCADATIEISGHTDSVGSVESNMALSESRAKAVVDYLARAGIAGERIVAKGFGPSQPRASNETAEGRAQNRRIEFKVQ